MSQYKAARDKLDEVRNELENLEDRTIKLSTKLDAFPESQYESMEFSGVNIDFKSHYSLNLFYPHIATDTLLLSNSLNRYYQKLDEFDRRYEEEWSGEIDHQKKEEISSDRREQEDLMNELRPIIRDLDQEVRDFGLEIYSSNPSASPLKRIASD